MITEEEFTAAMEAAVAERGEDFVYPDEWRDEYSEACRYSLPDGTPACIIGLALHKINPALVPTYDNTERALDVFEAIGDVPQNVALAAQRAQSQQDADKTWGVALEAYKDALEQYPR